MIKNTITIALAGVLFFGIQACKPKADFKKLEAGLEYKIVKDASGDKKPAMGDVVEMHIVLKVDDSVIANSRKENDNKPVQIMIQPSQYKGDWTNGITQLTAGDSAVFRMSIDSLKANMKGQMLPPWMNGKKNLVYEVVMVSVKSQEEMRKEQEQASAGQKATDDKLLQDYFAKNGLTPQKTSSGVYYIIETPGSGENAKAGQMVSVNYTGRNMDGTPFDSNTDPKFNHVEPFKVALGRGSVIPGWDEGLTYFKKGSKGKLFIPSGLAYGPSGNPPVIAANAVLIFDVEVTKIEDAPAAQNTQTPPPPVQ